MFIGLSPDDLRNVCAHYPDGLRRLTEDSGAHALGFVAPLFDAEEVRGGRADLIEARARRLLAAVAG